MEKHLDILKRLLKYWWNKDRIILGEFSKHSWLTEPYIYDYLKDK